MLLFAREDKCVGIICAVAALTSLTLGCTPGAGVTSATETSTSGAAATTTTVSTTGPTTGPTNATTEDATAGDAGTIGSSTTGTTGTTGSSTSSGSDSDDPKDALIEELEAIAAKTGAPALGVARLDGPELTALAVVGERRLGDPTAALVEDAFHLGSCTKLMTATMLAVLVEEGVFAWDETLEGVFPELVDGMHADYGAVTLEEVLAHRGGLPGNLLEFPEIHKALWQEGDPVLLRRGLTESLLSLAPETPPKTAGVYSNAGYMVVASAIEGRLESSWEELLGELIFEPLAMDSCGFGTPATEGRVDAPWGHVQIDDELVPVPPGPEADNPPPFGPAGRVHCNLRDWSRFVDLHRAGATGSEEFLGQGSWQRLHADHGDGFGLGLVVASDPKLGQILAMDGSNTTFYATFLILPGDDRALLAVANVGAPAGQVATVEALAVILQ